MTTTAPTTTAPTPLEDAISERRPRSVRGFTEGWDAATDHAAARVREVLDEYIWRTKTLNLLTDLPDLMRELADRLEEEGA